MQSPVKWLHWKKLKQHDNSPYVTQYPFRLRSNRKYFAEWNKGLDFLFSSLRTPLSFSNSTHTHTHISRLEFSENFAETDIFFVTDNQPWLPGGQHFFLTLISRISNHSFFNLIHLVIIIYSTHLCYLFPFKQVKSFFIQGWREGGGGAYRSRNFF